MERVTLYKFENSEIEISIEIYFNKKNQLIIDGYDIGKMVEDSWGDSDYEYTYTIEPKEVDKLYVFCHLKHKDKWISKRTWNSYMELLNTPDILQKNTYKAPDMLQYIINLPLI